MSSQNPLAAKNKMDKLEDLTSEAPLIGGKNDGEKDSKPKLAKHKLSVERIYQKKTQLEHILLRPDTYIGSVEPIPQTMWVYDGEEHGMVSREITYVPGLYKIFDEILVNAADNKQRDKNMDCIKIDIDPENNKIGIWNNGRGIPVVEHKEEKMYVPSLIFGHLLTSSNYNDEEKKVTGGRNGYGAKLCNIFSTKFTVETASKEYNKCFKQVWTENMTKSTEPKITPYKNEDYTCITFYPDLAKFKMDILDKDIVALMSRRAFDVAGSTRGVKVYLNGKRLPVKGFKEYVEQYVKGKEDDQGIPLKVMYEAASDRWEVAVSLSDRGFQQVSFVNSIATTKGGRHVDYVTEQVVTKLVDVVKKKNKGGVQVKPFQVKNHIWIFVNCLIENPTFDSQTKENMTLQPKSFGSKCQLSDKFFTQVLKCGIVESIMSWVRFKAQTELNKKCSATKHSKLKGIPKLEDANDAGTRNSIDCTLILTEGDSAKTLAVSGLGVVGRDKFGVFPLRGKMLNVREATHKQILENAEINNIIKIMGLQYKKKYESIDDLKTLRYGRLMIMTDQDQDGSHIKGLLINFIHHNWPSLLRLPFLEEFITPIVKATKGKEEKPFYSLPEFEEWKKETSNWPTWKIKYYKGLGTSTSKEAKEYFADMLRHRIKFKYQGTEDDTAIQLAFSKKMIEQRKEWLTNGMEERKKRRELGLPELYLYGKSTTSITFNDFVNKELILFSNMDNERSIPSLVDGLKPGQRKVMYTCFKRNDKREIKVAQLAGSVAEHSAYHHGESALMGTIINLAQNFVGSNNINLLQPIGQFGTRLQGGKDAASPRYIFTMLSPLARHIISLLDDPLLRYLYDDNLRIEPEYYVPIIPTVLVNGSEGIGTGWSTKIPNYNPREIVENIKRMIAGEVPLPMKPWFKNFRGVVEQLDNQRFVLHGEIAIIANNKIEITELPVRTWTQTYKEQVLEVMLHGTEKSPPLIMDYKEYHTDSTVRFVVTMSEDKLSRAEEQGLHKVFKLQTVLSTSTMVLFDHKGCLRKYESPEEILKEFYTVRLEFYVQRKDYMEGMLKAEASKLDNQARFIMEKIEGKIIIENRKKVDLIRTLQEKGYDSDPVKTWKEAQKKTDLETKEELSESEEEEQDTSGPDYDYLLGMSLWSLTREKKDELLKKRGDKRHELEQLQQKSVTDLWEDDLKNFLESLDQVEQKEREDEQAGLANKPVKLGKGGSVSGKSRPRKITLEETKPSPMGQRIVPRIDPDLKKRVEKIPGGGAGGDRKRGRHKKDEEGGIRKEGKGDSDGELLPLSERVGNSPDKIQDGKAKRKLKQGTLQFKTARRSSGSPKKKKPKRNPWSDSESERSNSDISDFDDKEYVPTEKRGAAPRRAASAKAKYTFDSDENEEDDDDEDEDGKMRNDAKPSSKINDFELPDIDGNGSSDSENMVQDRNKTKADNSSLSDNEDQVNADTNQVLSDSDDNFSPDARKAAVEKNSFDSLLNDSKPEENESNKAPSNTASSAPSPQVIDSDSSVDMPVEKNKREPPKAAPKKRVRKKQESDVSDEDFKPKPKKTSTAVRRPAAGGGKKKKAPPPSQPKGSESDEAPPEKPKKAKKKQAPPTFDNEENECGDVGDMEHLDDSLMVPRARSARARAPVKYNFGDDSSDEDF